MFAWYRELTHREKRTFWACFGGWGLDAMDVQIYSFLIPSLIAIWGITQKQAGLLGTVALIVLAAVVALAFVPQSSLAAKF